MFNFLVNLILNSPTRYITYADFIGAALYHPTQGYYMKSNQKIGRQGDFITTSNISDIFGRVFAKWIADVIIKHDLPPVFCEIGAGNGRFAEAFLQEWNKTIGTPLSYIIVESSPYHRSLQNELLNGSVKQVETLDELDSFEGIIFSNELFDALPVHVIEKSNGALFEIMIGINNECFEEVKIPLTNKEIIDFLNESGMILNENQRIEIPIEMGKMLQKISNRLTKGLVITVDYGYTMEEWLKPEHRKGSLRGYHQHQMVEDVLKNPGEMDITTHIHFDWLIKRGEQLDLHFLTKLKQDQFLLKIGILKELENHYDPNPFSEISKRNRAIKSLIMPSGMSSFFHVLIQEKGLEIEHVEGGLYQ